MGIPLRTTMLLLALLGAACSDPPIAPDPGGSIPMKLVFCAGRVPGFFAFRNEDGPWRAANAAIDGSFSFNVTERFTIAYFDAARGGITVVHTTAEELEPINGAQCTLTFAGRIVSGTVADVPAGSRAGVAVGSQQLFVGGGGGTPHYNTLVLDTPSDVVAHREAFVSPARTPNRVIIRRQVTIGPTIPVLDFSAPEAVPLDVHTATISGLTAGGLNAMGTEFRTSGGTLASLSYDDRFTSATRSIYAVPATLTTSGDTHLLFVAGGDADFARVRVVHMYYRNAADKTITLGADVAAPTVTVASTAPYVQPRIQLALQADYPRHVQVSLFQNISPQEARLWNFIATAGYRAGSEWDMTMPDLTGVPGFPIITGFVAGTPITRNLVLASGGSPIEALFPDRFVGQEGATIHFAYHASLVQVLP